MQRNLCCVLMGYVAAQRYNQGFDFVNCGADIVAVTAWMSAEMAKLRAETVKEEASSTQGQIEGHAGGYANS